MPRLVLANIVLVSYRYCIGLKLVLYRYHIGIVSVSYWYSIGIDCLQILQLPNVPGLIHEVTLPFLSRITELATVLGN